MNQYIKEIFEIFKKDNPEPKTELEYVNNYTLLVAVVLSAQSTDIGVNKATKKLFEEIKTPQQMLDLGEKNLKKYIKTIGLYNSKAKNIIKLSQKLIEDHNSEVPNNRDALEKLAGVGSKTAAVIMNCAFGEPLIAVDTHVFRVSNRLDIVKTTSPNTTEKPLFKILKEKLSRQDLARAHHWLIIHGRYTCKARTPACQTCKINQYCNYS